MKICVCSPSGRGDEPQPRVFYLGGRRLPVVAIVGHWADGGGRCFEVTVEDGRRFVLRHEPASGHWELAAVYGAGRVPARAPSA